MKIGIVCYPTFGGSGVLATELGKALAQKGHMVHFITYQQPVRLSEFMPNIFRFEISDDGNIWEPIIKEYEYSRVSKKQCKWNFSMINSAYLKMVIKLNRKTREGVFKTAFSNFKVLIAGIENYL